MAKISSMATILPTRITAIDDENYHLTTNEGTTYQVPLGTEIEEGILLKVDNFTFLKIIGTEVNAAINSSTPNENASTSTENPVERTNINRGKKWFSNSVKCLLAAYKENQHLFKTNNVKADDVWERIKLLMEQSDVHFSVEQIKTKFSKLKQAYCTVKDHNNQTGASPMDFGYMEEFEELFGRSHAVQPSAIASSSRHRPLHLSDNEEETVISKKRRLNSSQMILKNLETLQKRKEERQKERYEKKSQERSRLLTAIEESNTLYKNFMEKLLEKL